jgi:hypothetical protein
MNGTVPSPPPSPPKTSVIYFLSVAKAQTHVQFKLKHVHIYGSYFIHAGIQGKHQFQPELRRPKSPERNRS